MNLHHSLFTAEGIPLSRRAFWLGSVLFWGGFASFASVQAVLDARLSDKPLQLQAMLPCLVYWALWLLATPAVLGLVRRFAVLPCRKATLTAQALAVHAGAQVLLSAVAFGAEYLLRTALAATDGPARPALGAYDLAMWFVYRYNHTVALYTLLMLGYSIALYAYRYQQLKTASLHQALRTEQLESQLAGARLQALKMQLNPHFLFNTHHSIVSLIMQRQPERAIDMLTSLSDLLRSIIDTKEAQLIPLAEEVAFIQKYLAIQQLRFDDRLRVELCLGPGTERCPVPQFVLQPLVENAVVHGIEGLTGAGTVTIRAELRGAALLLTVEDDGVGRRARPRAGRSGGVGLANTQARLSQLYGPRARFEFEQPEAGGTRVAVHLPYSPAPAAPVAVAA